MTGVVHRDELQTGGCRGRLECLTQRPLGRGATEPVAGKDVVVVASEVEARSQLEECFAQPWCHWDGGGVHRLGPIMCIAHPVVVNADDTGVEVNGAPTETEGFPGQPHTGVEAAQPERVLESARRAGEELLDLVGIVEIFPPEYPFVVVASAQALYVRERINLDPTLAAGIVKRSRQEVPILIPRLRRSRR